MRMRRWMPNENEKNWTSTCRFCLIVSQHYATVDNGNQIRKESQALVSLVGQSCACCYITHLISKSACTPGSITIPTIMLYVHIALARACVRARVSTIVRFVPRLKGPDEWMYLHGFHENVPAPTDQKHSHSQIKIIVHVWGGFERRWAKLKFYRMRPTKKLIIW